MTVEVRRECQIPQNWNYWWLLATMGIPVTKRGPLQEQVVLTTESSLHTPVVFLYINNEHAEKEALYNKYTK